MGFGDGRHRAIISRSGEKDRQLASDLLDGTIDYQFWISPSPLGAWWFCAVQSGVTPSAGGFLSLARQAGGLLREELRAGLRLTTVEIGDDDLWTVALHHVAWSNTPNLPFRSVCTNYRAGDPGTEEEVDWLAAAPQLGQIPDLYMSEIYADPFAASAILIDLLSWTPPAEWRALMGNQAVHVAQTVEGVLTLLDRQQKSLIIAGVIIELSCATAPRRWVKWGDVVARVVAVTSLPERQVKATFKRAWSAVGSDAADVLKFKTGGHVQYQAQDAPGLHERYLHEWSHLQRRIAAFSSVP